MEELTHHNYGTRWWTNPECPYSYKYGDLDWLYPEEYFEDENHPNREKASNLYYYMQDIFADHFGREFETVVELGSGSGELTRQFYEYDLSYLVVEGTKAGWTKLMQKGIPHNKIVYKDLRKIETHFIYPKFDLAVCTEVAEHIEPWFASKIVELCTMYSDAVWFSAADENRPSHYHHPNEAPIEAWDNIFEFFGYKFISLDGRYDRADRLYIKNEN